MAETTVKNQICQHCGAEVRPNSLFCYSCGKSVAPEFVTDLPHRKNGSEAVEIKEVSGDKIADKPIQKPALGGAATKLKPVAEAEEPKLKSAAAMRRRTKSFQPKRVEIIWEEHENAPNLWFILAALLLTAFAAAVFYFAILAK